MDAFNSECRKLADKAGELAKGAQVLIEGRLKMDQWTDQGGTKRQRILIVADSIQPIATNKPQTNGSGSNSYAAPASRRAPAPAAAEVDGGAEADIPW